MHTTTLEALSAREKEVAGLLVGGYSPVNAAAILGVSHNTIRTYVRRLYQKLGVSNRVELVLRWLESEAVPASAGGAPARLTASGPRGERPPPPPPRSRPVW